MPKQVKGKLQVNLNRDTKNITILVDQITDNMN